MADGVEIFAVALRIEWFYASVAPVVAATFGTGAGEWVRYGRNRGRVGADRF
jgi:hypothetical protein